LLFVVFVVTVVMLGTTSVPVMAGTRIGALSASTAAVRSNESLLAPAGITFKTLYRFTGGADGDKPEATMDRVRICV
jgi:hypothetical protein